MSITEWRPVAGYEGLYEVSDHGAVRRVPRSRAHATERRELKPWITTTGYLCVSLYRSGIARKYKVHRLVAIAFLPSADLSLDVCHNNGDRLNAAVSNLRWDTRSGNMRDTIKHGTHRNQFRGRTSCANGHEFTKENTLIAVDGRKCRTCRRNRVRAWRARAAA